MFFVDVSVVDDAIQMSSEKKALAHTHTKTVDKTSKGLGVPGRSCVARNSHNQHPERIFVVENLKCANYPSFKGLKSYCD